MTTLSLRGSKHLGLSAKQSTSIRQENKNTLKNTSVVTFLAAFFSIDFLLHEKGVFRAFVTAYSS